MTLYMLAILVNLLVPFQSTADCNAQAQIIKKKLAAQEWGAIIETTTTCKEQPK